MSDRKQNQVWDWSAGRFRWGACFALLVLSSGCVKFKPTTLVRYASDSDTFDVVQILERIQYEYDGEAENLSMMWAKRADWIPIVLDDGLGDISLLRDGKHQFRPFQAGSEWGDPVETKINLNELEIRPGEFFHNESSGLCFYQQVSFTGKFLDKVLDEVLQAALPELRDDIQKDLQMPAPKLSWDTVRRRLRNLGKNETDDSVEGETRLVFSDATLKAMLQHDPVIQREGAVVIVSIPMTQADQSQVILTDQVARRANRNELEASNALLVSLYKVTQLQSSEERLLLKMDLSDAIFHDWTKAENAVSADTQNRDEDDASGSNRKYLSLEKSLEKLIQHGVEFEPKMTVEKAVRNAGF